MGLMSDSLNIIQNNHIDAYYRQVTFVSIGSAYSNAVHNKIEYLFVTDEINVTCIDVGFAVDEDKVHFYDGPGKLSPMMNLNSSSMCFSKYIGFVSYYEPNSQSTIDKLCKAGNMLLNLTWQFVRNSVSSNTCMKTGSLSHELRAYHNEANGISCIWHFDGSKRELHLKQMTFEGPDMLSTHASPSICQYGGLFIKYKLSNGNIQTFAVICTNVKHVMPLRVPNVYADSKLLRSEIFIVFITFSAYTSGSFLLELNPSTCTDSYDCYGYDSDTCLVGSSFSDRRLRISKPQNMIECKELWIMHSLLPKDINKGLIDGGKSFTAVQ